MSDLGDLVRRHGGQLYHGGRSAVIPGPGHSRADRSLSLRLGEDGRVVFYSHAGDGCGEVMTYLGLPGRGGGGRAGWAERQAWARRRRLVAAERRRQAAADRALCAGIWNAAQPLAGTPAEAYLRGRGIVAPDWPTLGFHPAAPRSKQVDAGGHPALVALVADADGGPCALHLTFIAADGAGKAFGAASRRMFGPTAGHAVQLSPIGADGVLAVAEGIETALAYRALTGRPTWACLSTAGLKTFRLPAAARRLVVAADHDANGAGLRAATALAERACRRLPVEIDLPPSTTGASRDWADVLAEGGR